MTRGQAAVLFAFAAIVAAIAIFVVPKLLEPRGGGAASEDGSLSPDRPRPDASRSPASSSSRAPDAPGSSATSREPDPTTATARARSALDVKIIAVAPTGEALPAESLRFFGGARVGGTSPLVVRRRADRVWVGAPGRLFAALAPAPGSDEATVTLAPAGPPIAVTVVEDDGRPAADVPVLWRGPDEKPLARRTDAAGRVTVNDQPNGLLIVSVGGTERAGPTLRLRVGADEQASATLDPPLVVTGKVRDAAGQPVAGARIRGLVPAGRAGRDVTTRPDGLFRWTGRATDRLVLVASTPDGRATAAEPAPPDARRALVATADLTLPASVAAIDVEFTHRSIGGEHGRRGAFDFVAALRAEPASLALAREAFGTDSVAYEPFEAIPEPGVGESPPVVVSGIGFDGPVRVQTAGEAVPEDHIVPASSGRTRSVRIDPRAAPSLLSSSSSPAGAEQPRGRVTGRVRDGQGAALAGVTVLAGVERSTTDQEGRFTVLGLEPGARVELIYGFLDGADTGLVDPKPFAPWFSSSVRAASLPDQPPTSAPAAPADEPLDLVLPKSASVAFRAVNGLDGSPLSWVRVLVVDGQHEPRFDDVVATRDGRVLLDGLVAGTPGSLILFAPGLRREVPLALRAGETVDAGEVSLASGRRVEGVVLGPGGSPVAGAVVAAFDDSRGDSAGHALVVERDLFLRRVASGRDGVFALDGLDPTHEASLAVYAAGLALQAVHAPLPAPGAATAPSKLTVKLSRGTTLRVRIEDKDGRPLSGAAVELRAKGGTRWLKLIRAAGLGSVVGSDSDIRLATEALWTEDPARPGSHRLGPIEPGPYDVVALLPGYKPSRARTTIVENPFSLPADAMDLRVVLEPEPALGPK